MGQYNAYGIDKKVAKTMILSDELAKGEQAKDIRRLALKSEEEFWNTKLDEELSWIRRESRLLSYGEIGIVFTIHDGKIVKIQQQTGRSIKI